MTETETQFGRFHELHHRDTPLLLGNAWDAISAKLLEQAGFKALGTTSAGMAASLGWADNEQLPVEQLCAAIERIARVSTVPLSADIETGYSGNNERFDALIMRLLDAGVVGVNLQDACGTDVDLMPIAEVCRRIKRCKALALGCHQQLFINARTDVYWIASHARDPAAQNIALQRALAFREAGADCIFLPGLRNLDIAGDIAAKCALPLNLLASAGLPPWDELKAFGISRISLGSGLFRLLFGHFRRTAVQLAEHKSLSLLSETDLSYAELENLYPPEPCRKA